MATVETNASTIAHEGGIVAWAADLYRGFQEWRAYRRTVKALSALTDADLDDIGLCRADIKQVARTGRK